MRIASLLVAAFILTITGLTLGLAPGSVTGANGKDFSCGSPWNMDAKEIERQVYIDDLANSMVGRKVWDTDYRTRCEDALDSRGAFAWIAISLGAVALVGIALVHKPQAAAPATPDN